MGKIRTNNSTVSQVIAKYRDGILDEIVAIQKRTDEYRNIGGRDPITLDLMKKRKAELWERWFASCDIDRELQKIWREYRTR